MTLASHPPEVALPGNSSTAAGLRIVPAHYPGRTIGTAAGIVIAVLNSALGYPRCGWPVFAE
jgi:hypothetical protein